MTNHTPGPWHRNVHARFPVYAALCPKHTLVCAMIPNSGISEEEKEANLNLIIAAPDMYEALRKVRTCMSIPEYVMALVSAAIAKAEGRTP